MDTEQPIIELKVIGNGISLLFSSLKSKLPSLEELHKLLFIREELHLLAKCLHFMYITIIQSKVQQPSLSAIFMLKWTETAALQLTDARKETNVIYDLILQCWQKSRCDNFHNLLPILHTHSLASHPFSEISNLNTKLFTYQIKTLDWLLSCENSLNRQEPFWMQINSVYLNICTRNVSKTLPIVKQKGGILADEVS
jgi:hypothetical protein